MGLILPIVFLGLMASLSPGHDRRVRAGPGDGAGPA